MSEYECVNADLHTLIAEQRGEIKRLTAEAVEHGAMNTDLHVEIERLNAMVAVKDAALDEMAAVLVAQNTTIERLRYWDAYDAVMAKANQAAALVLKVAELRLALAAQDATIERVRAAVDECRGQSSQVDNLIDDIDDAIEDKS